jgi:hypothetical protein
MRITISRVPALGAETEFIFQESNVGPGFSRFYPIEVVNDYSEDLILSLQKVEVVDNIFLLDVTTLSFAKDQVDFLTLRPGFDVAAALNQELICVKAGEKNQQLGAGIKVDPQADNFYQGKSFTIKYHLQITGVNKCGVEVEQEEAQSDWTNEDLSVTIEQMNEGTPSVAVLSGGGRETVFGVSGGRCPSLLIYLILFFTLLNFVLLLGLYQRQTKKKY